MLDCLCCEEMGVTLPCLSRCLSRDCHDFARWELSEGNTFLSEEAEVRLIATGVVLSCIELVIKVVFVSAGGVLACSGRAIDVTVDRNEVID